MVVTQIWRGAADTAVRVTVNNKQKEHWALQRIISTPSSPLAWLLCAVGNEELIARITTSVTSPQQIHITHSSLNPNVITFTTFASSINQQEHFDKHIRSQRRIQDCCQAGEGPEKKSARRYGAGAVIWFLAVLQTLLRTREQCKHVIIFSTVKLWKLAGEERGRGRRSVVVPGNCVIRADTIIQWRVSSNLETHLT